MELAHFVSSHLINIALIACAAFGVGDLTLRRQQRIFLPLERVIIALTLGLGIIGTLVFLLGVLSLLYWWPLFIGLASMAACGLFRAREIVGGLARPGWRTIALAAAGIAVLAPVLYAAMYPPTAIDALTYHLPAAKSYIQMHRLRPIEHLRFPVLPALNEMLFAAALLLFDDVTAQLVEVLFLVLTLATLVSWAQRLGRPLTGLWSVGLLVGTPSLMLLASTAYVDVGLTAFSTAGFYALHRYYHSNCRTWLILAGAFGGCAAGTKHSGLVLLVILAAGSAVAARRGGARLRTLWPFAVAALAFAAPWYLWIAYWTGNPVWPFLGRLLGYGFWTQTDAAWLNWSMKRYGWGSTFRSALLLPWNLAFREVVGEPPLQAAPFVLLPLSVAWALRTGRGRGLLVMIGTYTMFWFFTSQQVRFLLPVLPILALVDAWSLDEASRGLRQSARSSVGSVIAVVVFVALSYPVRGLYRLAVTYGPLPTNGIARDGFLRQRMPSYGMYRDLNSRFDHRYTIYSLHDEAMRYYCDGIQIGDWFGFGRYGDVPLDSAAKLAAFLRGLKADFLLVRSAGSAAALASAPGSQQFFETIQTNGDVRLFRVKAGTK